MSIFSIISSSVLKGVPVPLATNYPVIVLQKNDGFYYTQTGKHLFFLAPLPNEQYLHNLTYKNGWWFGEKSSQIVKTKDFLTWEVVCDLSSTAVAKIKNIDNQIYVVTKTQAGIYKLNLLSPTSLVFIADLTDENKTYLNIIDFDYDKDNGVFLFLTDDQADNLNSGIQAITLSKNVSQVYDKKYVLLSSSDYDRYDVVTYYNNSFYLGGMHDNVIISTADLILNTNLLIPSQFSDFTPIGVYDGKLFMHYMNSSIVEVDGASATLHSIPNGLILAPWTFSYSSDLKTYFAQAYRYEWHMGSGLTFEHEQIYSLKKMKWSSYDYSFSNTNNVISKAINRVLPGKLEHVMTQFFIKMDTNGNFTATQDLINYVDTTPYYGSTMYPTNVGQRSVIDSSEDGLRTIVGIAAKGPTNGYDYSVMIWQKVPSSWPYFQFAVQTWGVPIKFVKYFDGKLIAVDVLDKIYVLTTEYYYEIYVPRDHQPGWNSDYSEYNLSEITDFTFDGSTYSFLYDKYPLPKTNNIYTFDKDFRNGQWHSLNANATYPRLMTMQALNGTTYIGDSSATMWDSGIYSTSDFNSFSFLSRWQRINSMNVINNELVAVGKYIFGWDPIWTISRSIDGVNWTHTVLPQDFYWTYARSLQYNEISKKIILSAWPPSGTYNPDGTYSTDGMSLIFDEDYNLLERSYYPDGNGYNRNRFSGTAYIQV